MQKYYYDFIEEKNTILSADIPNEIVYLKNTYGHIYNNYNEELVGQIHQLEIVSENTAVLERMVARVKQQNKHINEIVWLRGLKQISPLAEIFADANKLDLDYTQKTINKVILTRRVECDLHQWDESHRKSNHEGLNLLNIKL